MLENDVIFKSVLDYILEDESFLSWKKLEQAELSDFERVVVKRVIDETCELKPFQTIKEIFNERNFHLEAFNNMKCFMANPRESREHFRVYKQARKLRFPLEAFIKLAKERGVI